VALDVATRERAGGASDERAGETVAGHGMADKRAADSADDRAGGAAMVVAAGGVMAVGAMATGVGRGRNRESGQGDGNSRQCEKKLAHGNLLILEDR
jgi:hypothetical protein